MHTWQTCSQKQVKAKSNVGLVHRLMLKHDKFGVVYNVEGTEIGKRVYHVECYKLEKQEGTVKLEAKDDEHGQTMYTVEITT